MDVVVLSSATYSLPLILSALNSNEFPGQAKSELSEWVVSSAERVWLWWEVKRNDNSLYCLQCHRGLPDRK